MFAYKVPYMSILSQKCKYKLIHLTSYSLSIQTMEQNQIHFRAEFSIDQGKIEEYKKQIQEMSRMIEANEPDTINYQFYLNKDQTKCLVHETYEDSDAALAHGNGVASRTILTRIFTLAKVSRFDVYGNPNVELQKSLASFGAETFNLFTGFSR
jgi:quinol monooxygenase YgiN